MQRCLGHGQPAVVRGWACEGGADDLFSDGEGWLGPGAAPGQGFVFLVPTTGAEAHEETDEG